MQQRSNVVVPYLLIVRPRALPHWVLEMAFGAWFVLRFGCKHHRVLQLLELVEESLWHPICGTRSAPKTWATTSDLNSVTACTSACARCPLVIFFLGLFRCRCLWFAVFGPPFVIIIALDLIGKFRTDFFVLTKILERSLVLIEQFHVAEEFRNHRAWLSVFAVCLRHEDLNQDGCGNLRLVFLLPTRQSLRDHGTKHT